VTEFRRGISLLILTSAFLAADAGRCRADTNRPPTPEHYEAVASRTALLSTIPAGRPEDDAAPGASFGGAGIIVFSSSSLVWVDTAAVTPPVLAAVPAAPAPGLFKWEKLNNLVITIIFIVLTFFFVRRAKKRPDLYIRRLAGLEAIDEAVGRATEMGKPVTYLTGTYDIDQISTIASVNILSYVARKVAEYDSRLIVPCKYSVAMSVCQETVREAYANAGRPDAYNPDDIFYVAGEQFSYTAAVDGILVREKPAANFLMGTFAAEALILAETGASTGAIQIAGTDSFYQIPFFVVCCDYCLIGEELYAASAYLSHEPRLLGTLKAQDAGKIVLVGAILLAAGALLISRATGIEWLQNLILALRPF